LDHPAEAVRQVQDQVGKCLGAFVKVKAVTISKNAWVLHERFAGPIAVLANKPRDYGLDGLADVLQHPPGGTRRPHPVNGRPPVRTLPSAGCDD
jgi:hypothetical protein